jgi:adenylosuccinate synthase
MVNLLGPGVAVDIEALFAELDGLLAAGVPLPDLRISERAQVVLPVHVLHDQYEEERLGAERVFGSTRAGIAPFYADKYLKVGVQVGDLFDEAWLRERVERCLISRNVLFRELYDEPEVEAETIVTSLLIHAERLEPMLCDVPALLHERLAAGETILAEGQLGALRDPDHGIYPTRRPLRRWPGSPPSPTSSPSPRPTAAVSAPGPSSPSGRGPGVIDCAGSAVTAVSTAPPPDDRAASAPSTPSPRATAAVSRELRAWPSPTSTCSPTSTRSPCARPTA